MTTGAEREARQSDRLTIRGDERRRPACFTVVLLQFYVSSIALVYTVLMLRKITNRIHKVTKFMGSGSISKDV